MNLGTKCLTGLNPAATDEPPARGETRGNRPRVWHMPHYNMNTATTAKQPRHRTVLISPTGDEFYEAYGPMTKDVKAATLFYTNPKTLGEPVRFGNTCGAFWNSEREAAAKARREYRGWTFRIEPVIQHHITNIGLDFIDTTGQRVTCFQLVAGNTSVAVVDYAGESVERIALTPTLKGREEAILRLAARCRARSVPQSFAPSH